ncbi:uncharacterized protein LOC108668287, partial [Hyalella azteca]|uniref:Uncharacterized protein LOC108668287 n=1 Tax=Hyalella azteca TaxID=294128 RepID=A0A8B7NBI5_HYAAZ
MYATSATLATGTPGVCHIATQPQVPSGLANYTGYIALIRGRVDSGCDEILGYEKLGAAGCIWLSDVTLDRDSGRAACKTRGGDLAVLDTTDKYDAVAKQLQAIRCDEILGYEKLGAAGCIWLSDVTLDRDSGRAACQARGGDLAVLDTTDKYDAVAKQLQAI